MTTDTDLVFGTDTESPTFLYQMFIYAKEIEILNHLPVQFLVSMAHFFYFYYLLSLLDHGNQPNFNT